MKISRTFIRSAALACTAALALSSCAYLSPTQTHYFYQSAEGAVENLNPEGPNSPIGVRNLLAVKSADQFVLTGSITNQTTTDYIVSLSALNGASGDFSIEVPAGETVELGAGGTPLTLTGEVAPGANITVNFSAGSETKDVTVQVLDDSLEYLGTK